MWTLDQQQQHNLGTCKKMQVLRYHLTLNLQLLEWDPATHILTSPLGDFDVPSSLKLPVLDKQLSIHPLGKQSPKGVRLTMSLFRRIIELLKNMQKSGHSLSFFYFKRSSREFYPYYNTWNISSYKYLWQNSINWLHTA